MRKVWEALRALVGAERFGVSVVWAGMRLVGIAVLVVAAVVGLDLGLEVAFGW